MKKEEFEKQVFRRNSRAIVQGIGSKYKELILIDGVFFEHISICNQYGRHFELCEIHEILPPDDSYKYED